MPNDVIFLQAKGTRKMLKLPLALFCLPYTCIIAPFLNVIRVCEARKPDNYINIKATISVFVETAK